MDGGTAGPSDGAIEAGLDGSEPGYAPLLSRLAVPRSRVPLSRCATVPPISVLACSAFSGRSLTA